MLIWKWPLFLRCSAQASRLDLSRTNCRLPCETRKTSEIQTIGCRPASPNSPANNYHKINKRKQYVLRWIASLMVYSHWVEPETKGLHNTARKLSQCTCTKTICCGICCGRDSDWDNLDTWNCFTCNGFHVIRPSFTKGVNSFGRHSPM